MRVLVTRPAEDAVALVADLAAHGIAAAVEPLMTIQVLAGSAPDLAGVQALLVTSANGIRAFASRSPDRSPQVYAVGEASAASARALGFVKVESADGDVVALAALVKRRAHPGRGILLHVSGSEVAGDLGGALSAAGFVCRREVLYRAQPVTSLSPATLDLFHSRTLDGVLLFSPRTASIFVRLAKAAGIDRLLAQVRAYCLSDAVAAEAGLLDWLEVRVAAMPQAQALLDCLVTGPP